MVIKIMLIMWLISWSEPQLQSHFVLKLPEAFTCGVRWGFGDTEGGGGGH